MPNTLTNVNVTAVPHKTDGGNTYIYKGGRGNSAGSLNLNNLNGANAIIDNINVKNLYANRGEFVYIQSQDGNIVRLSGDELNYMYGSIKDLTTDDLTSKRIKTEDLEAVKAWIETLNSHEITTEYLTVTKQAHFFELVIDKIRSVGGQIIVTAANAVIDAAFAYDSSNNLIPVLDDNNIDSVAYYEVWWKCTDDTGRKTDQGFLQNDQALCMSFNNVHEGVNYDVSNKYYWRLVDSICADTYVNFSTGSKLSVNDTNTVQIEKNHYHIKLLDTYYTDQNNTSVANNISWNASTPSISGVYTNVSWANDSTLPSGAAVSGTFSSASKTYGLNIIPLANTNGTKQFITSALDFEIYQILGDGSYKAPQNINIGVYFDNDTFSIFNNVEVHPYDSQNPSQSYVCHLDLGNPNVGIEAIVITSTNDVDWHLCHGMRLSNNFIPASSGSTRPAANSGCDYMLDGYASVPTAGDNIVQLGYRSSQDNVALSERDLETQRRQSAIIIAAYQSIDKGDTINGTVVRPISTPSYAQYMGINEFNLTKFRETFFDAKGAVFKGDITLCSINENGNTVNEEFQKILNSSSKYLVPNKEVLMARVKDAIVNANSTEETEVKLECDLNYSLKNVGVGGTNSNNSEIINWSELPSDWKLYADVYSTHNNLITTLEMQNGVLTSNIAEGQTGYCYYNLLRMINNSGPYDYIELQEWARDTSHTDKCPLYIKVRLMYGSKLIDQRTVNVELQSGAVFKVMDDAIVSQVSQQISEVVDEDTIASIQELSEMIQTSGGFDMLAQRLTSIENVNASQQRTIDELAEMKIEPDEIVAEVSRQVTTDQGFISTIASNVQVTADGITLNHLNELMQRTGIDIYDGTINLVALNTNVIGNLNIPYQSAIQLFNEDKSNVTLLEADDLGQRNTFKISETVSLNVQQTGNKAAGNTLTVTYPAIELGTFNPGDTVNLTAYFNLYDGNGGHTIVQSGNMNTMASDGATNDWAIRASLYVKNKNGNNYETIFGRGNVKKGVAATIDTTASNKLYSIYVNGPVNNISNGEKLYANLVIEYKFRKRNDDYDGTKACAYVSQVELQYDMPTSKPVNVIAADGFEFMGPNDPANHTEMIWYGQQNINSSNNDNKNTQVFGVSARRNHFRVSTWGIQRAYDTAESQTDKLWNGTVGTWGDGGENSWFDIGSYDPVFIWDGDSLDLSTKRDGNSNSDGPLIICRYGTFVIQGGSGGYCNIQLPKPQYMKGKKLKFVCTRANVRTDIRCVDNNQTIVPYGKPYLSANSVMIPISDNMYKWALIMSGCTVSFFSDGTAWICETPVIDINGTPSIIYQNNS